MSEMNYFNTNPQFIKAKYFNKGRVKPLELIVIHTMEAPEKGTTAESVGKYFQNIGVKASTHYGVDNDSVVQYVYDSNTAFGCKNANANGVHIEHAGYADQNAADWSDEYSQAMLKKSAQIAAYLCEKFNIPVQKAVFKSESDPTVIKRGFCGHADVPLHGSHYDPGKNFPWPLYLRLVKEELAKNIS
jgi:N-acetyl-anhydromuramyl-L-alanine amidase AmpD